MELSEQILGSFYKPEVIHTKSVERIGKGKVKVMYAFPDYHRTIVDMGHVGMSQMNEGLVEGLYCAIGYAIEEGHLNVEANIQSFIRRMAEALFMKQNISFRKMLKPQEQATLIITVTEQVQEKIRGQYYAVVSHIDGFMRGEVECWLPKKESVAH